MESSKLRECQMASLTLLSASQQLQIPGPVIESDFKLSCNLLKKEIGEKHLPQNHSPPCQLTSQEMFQCAACPGPVGRLPSFPNFKHVSLHSMKTHKVNLERAVQASTLLPITLTMYVCKLCPEEIENLCLNINEIKSHLQKIHSDFFVKTWKEFTELQCRVCDMVIEENTIDDHMNTFHPRDLFAEMCDIMKEDNVEMDQNENIGSAHDANLKSLTKDFETVWECFRPENLIKKYFPPISGSSQDQDLSDNDQGLPPKPATNLSKPMALVLDCKRFVAPVCESPKLTPDGKTFNPKGVVMIGIKKEISVESIRKFFMGKGVKVKDIRISNGSGVVTFKNLKDAEDYGGKEIEVEDCVIRTCNRKNPTLAHSRNVLYMRRIPKTVSLDDLHDFFWRELCVIDDIDLMNGQGKVFFRLREDVEEFAGKVIEVKDSSIKLLRIDGFMEKRFDRGGRHGHGRWESGGSRCGLGGFTRPRSRSKQGRERK